MTDSDQSETLDLAALIRDMVEDEIREIRRPESVSSYLSVHSSFSEEPDENENESKDLKQDMNTDQAESSIQSQANNTESSGSANIPDDKNDDKKDTTGSKGKKTATVKGKVPKAKGKAAAPKKTTTSDTNANSTKASGTLTTASNQNVTSASNKKSKDNKTDENPSSESHQNSGLNTISAGSTHENENESIQNSTELNPNQNGPPLDLDKMKDMIQGIVRETWQNEVTVESKNEKQLLDILRLRDNEVIKAHERVAEVSGLLVAADKTLEAMRAQIREIEHEKEDLQNRMIAARVTEQKATTIVDVNTKRSEDLSRDLESEKNRRNEERRRLQREVEQAKEGHRVEVMAYRRALSTEEAKVVALQQELRDSRKRIAELQRQNASGPIQMLTNGSNYQINSTSSPNDRQPKFGNKKKKLKSIEDIYSPLSASTGALPKINAKK